MKLSAWHGLLLLAVLAAAVAIFAVAGREQSRSLVFSIGDVQVVHADLSIGDRTIQGSQRVSAGDRVSTGSEGRARLRLDDGTLVAIDKSTRFELAKNRLLLEAGRIFVQGGPTAVTQLSVAGATTSLASSAVAVEAGSEGAKIYCASGELVVTAGSEQTRIQSGESAALTAAGISVAPEQAFDDWTGGLAVPWSSAVGGRSAIPMIEGASGPDDPGTPLVIRSHRVDVVIDGELAVTKSRTIYFNGSSLAAQGNVRLALPEDAIVRGVRYKHTGADSFVDAELRIAGSPTPHGRIARGLEWAGGGWLRGELAGIEAGKTLELELEYVQWLDTRGGRAAYRYPMDGGREPPLVGEVAIDVATSKAQSPFLSVSAGASIDKQDVVHFRQADARPTGDLVVELSPSVVKPAVARAYVQSGGQGEDPYVMIRTEAPPASPVGLTLAVVVDASTSIGAATLETQRAVVDAILEGLGPKDRVVLLAADQTTRSVGPDAPTPVTPKLVSELRKRLGELRPGGASNLGAALERAADILDAPGRGADAGSGMVVYVGDGRPTVGASDARSIRRLLQKRAGGMPRLGAIAVGPAANRWLLAKLMVGVGSVYEVLDRSDAARAGALLLTSALEPTVRDVALDLGPHIDRIYPRENQAVVAGSTVTVVGRLRGALPKTVVFSVRDGKEHSQTTRGLGRVLPAQGSDLAQRWALARIKELAAGDEPIEPAIAVAREARVLTPWTSWFFETGSDTRPLPYPARVLELSADFDTAFAERVEPLMLTGSTLLEPPKTFGGGVSLDDAVAAAVRRILERARKSVQACRDARIAVRPNSGRSFSIDLAINGQGQTTRVRVMLADGGRDAVLERCIEGVVKSLPFVAAGVAAQVTHTLNVPESRGVQRTRCSGASKVSLPLRKGLWRARAPLGAQSYLSAAASCEFKQWADRRAFLLLLLEGIEAGEQRLDVARELDEAGEDDAAAFVRQETLRRVSNFAELEHLSQLLTRDEPNIDAAFDKAYRQANSDRTRLSVVHEFLRLAPHNGLARRRLLALLEALGEQEALLQEVRSVSAEPIIDAGLLARGASALGRIGHQAEGLRTFGDLIERAPRDPWTLAFVGDRLRAEQRFDEAGAAYARLGDAVPDDAGVALRMALAHAGAGRLDVATRLLERVTQTGGRGDDGRVGELASITRAVLLARARTDAPASEREALTRRLLQTPLPDVAGVVLVHWPPTDDPLSIRIKRARGEGLEQSPDFDASSLGMAAFRIERGDGAARILLKRPEEPGPSKPAHATVSALVLGDTGTEPRLIPRDVAIEANGKDIELTFDQGTLL
jgi:tetratricopeptide (TPR) repeat protein